eukprot:47476-Eustigmatos_ZCMA.PRE.1
MMRHFGMQGTDKNAVPGITYVSIRPNSQSHLHKHIITYIRYRKKSGQGLTGSGVDENIFPLEPSRQEEVDKMAQK